MSSEVTKNDKNEKEITLSEEITTTQNETKLPISPETTVSEPISTEETEKPVLLHLSSSESRDFIPLQKLLATKQKVFAQIREMEDERIPRHAACYKLCYENWNKMKNHLDEGYDQIKNLSDYALKFLEAHKKLIFTHQYLQRAIIPTLTNVDSKGAPIDTSLKPMMQALQALHDGSIVKLNEFITKMSSVVIDNQLKPMKEQYKIEIDNFNEEMKTALKNYEKVGKSCATGFEKLNDTLTKSIKCKEEGKINRQDFWIDQSFYLTSISTEANTQISLKTHLSQAYERIKNIETKRIESTESAMKSLVETTQTLYKDLGIGFDDPLSNSKIDSSIDINRLNDLMSKANERTLTLHEQSLADKPPADTIPVISESPLILKYGILALQNAMVWESVHVIVTQDFQMMIYKGPDSEDTDKFLVSQTTGPTASILLNNSVVTKREVVHPCAFEVTEKKRQIMWSTTAKYMLRVSSEEDLLEWMDLFNHMRVTEDTETFSI